jgi:hypothetical protein
VQQREGDQSIKKEGNILEMFFRDNLLKLCNVASFVLLLLNEQYKAIDRLRSVSITQNYKDDDNGDRKDTKRTLSLSFDRSLRQKRRRQKKPIAHHPVRKKRSPPSAIPLQT